MYFLLLFCYGIIFVNAEYLLDEEYLQEKWTLYQIEYSKEYNSRVENEFRKKIFSNNLMVIEEHNEKYYNGLVTYEMGINKFTDRLYLEYINDVGLYDVEEEIVDNYTRRLYIPESIKVAEEIDWTLKGAVTPIKEQGKHCGACYAFAAVGILESANYKVNNKLVSLSEQNIISCSLNYTNKGCNGGYIYKSLQYIKENGGIDTEASYPYRAKNAKCFFKEKNIGAKVDNFDRLTYGDEDNMKRFVSEEGPIGITVDFKHPSVQHYRKGVFYEKNCRNKANHAMVIVGYGKERGLDYWKVKNSWGKSWGDNGYILMSRNHDNNCGIASFGVHVTAEKLCN